MVEERESLNPNDDLWYALENNPPATFSVVEIESIVAEVPGENDELDWWWILKLGEGKYFLLRGWCDYTGWDCQSAIDESYGTFPSALEAAKAAPDCDEAARYCERNIEEALIGQVNGTVPFGTITIDYKKNGE